MGTDCNIQMTTSTLKKNKKQYLFTQHEIMLRKLTDIGCQRSKRSKGKLKKNKNWRSICVQMGAIEATISKGNKHWD